MTFGTDCGSAASQSVTAPDCRSIDANTAYPTQVSLDLDGAFSWTNSNLSAADYGLGQWIGIDANHEANGGFGTAIGGSCTGCTDHSSPIYILPFGPPFISTDFGVPGGWIDQQGAFLATPLAPEVPEPAAWVLLLSGAALLLKRRA